MDGPRDSRPVRLVAPDADVLGSSEGMSRRILLLRAGTTAAHEAGCLVGGADPPLSPLGRAQVAERRHQWEWADVVVVSPSRRARESAAILAAAAQVTIEPAFAPLDLGRWQGLRSELVAQRDPIAFADWQAGSPLAQPPGGEALSSFRIRVADGVARLLRNGRVSPLVVSHGEVIREIVALLSGELLARGRPAPSELALLTRGARDRFHLGRNSSDPEPLRSALERCGLSGVGEWRPERHIGHFELRTEGAA